MTVHVTALKCQFPGSYKLYEYYIESPHITLKDLQSKVTDGELFALVSPRGEAKMVRVVEAIPYMDRMYSGDLKHIDGLFEGKILWMPLEDRQKEKRAALNPESQPIDSDDIPF